MKKKHGKKPNPTDRNAAKRITTPPKGSDVANRVNRAAARNEGKGKGKGGKS